MELGKQFKPISWLGGFQVQISNSMFYFNLIMSGMAILTFWYTAGYQIQGRYVPWMSLYLFVGAVFLGLLAIMYFDYKFVYPSRQAFVNRQACKHENPWMDEILEVRKDTAEMKADIKAIKAKLEIE